MPTDTYWKLMDFAKVVDKHFNTVNNWFNKLEERAIHYTNRAGEDKIYDQLDLDIALFIKDRRDEKWSMDAIIDDLPNHFEMRPFPLDYVFENPQNLDMVTIKREVEKVLSLFAATKMEELRLESDRKLLQIQQTTNDRIEQLKTENKVSKQEGDAKIQQLMKEIEEYKKQQEELTTVVNKPVNETQIRQQKVTDRITEKRIEHKLEIEALGLWSQKPESERMVKVGWFKKVEDIERKDRFVKEYVREHFEQHLRAAYGIE